MPKLNLEDVKKIQQEIIDYRQRPDSTIDTIWRDFCKDVGRSNIAVIENIFDKNTLSSNSTILLTSDPLKDIALIKTQLYIDIMRTRFDSYPCLQSIFQFSYQEILAYPYREFMQKYIIDHSIKYNIDISATTNRPCYFIHLKNNGFIHIRARVKVSEFLVVDLNPSHSSGKDQKLSPIKFLVNSQQSNPDCRYTIDIILKPDASFEVTQVSIPCLDCYRLCHLNPDLPYYTFREYLSSLESSIPEHMLTTTSKEFSGSSTAAPILRALPDPQPTIPLTSFASLAFDEDSLLDEIAEFEVLANTQLAVHVDFTSSYTSQDRLFAPLYLLKSLFTRADNPELVSELNHPNSSQQKPS